jgi:tRNA (Thr-GGU) A37 N-methylase
MEHFTMMNNPHKQIDISEEFAKFETGVEEVDKSIMYILENIPYVDIKPYSHNIINCSLRHLSKLGYNDTLCIDIIRETPLMDLGWGNYVKKHDEENKKKS